MKRLLSYILVILALAIPLAAQSDDEKGMMDKVKDAAKDAADKAADAVRGRPEPTFSVSGRVYFANNGLPVRRTYFDLVQVGYHTDDPEFLEKKPKISIEKYSFDGRGRWLTNDRGEFTVKGLPRGWYVAIFPTPGILNPRTFDFKYDIFPKILITEQNVDNVEIAVRMGGSVSGIVRYPDGEPLVNAMVSLFTFKSIGESEAEIEEAENVESVRTDDRGFYRFAGLPPGKYVVMASRPVKHIKSESYNDKLLLYNNEVLATYHPNTVDVFEAENIELGLGVVKKDIDIEFINRKLSKVKAKAIDSETKKPISGLSFKFKRLDYQVREGFTWDSGETDKDGVIELSDMLPGKYEINVFDGKNSLSRLGEVRYAPNKKSFEVVDKGNNEFVIEVDKGGAVGGEIVVGKDVVRPTQVTVSLKSHKITETDRVSSGLWDRELKRIVASEKQEFEVDGLPAGKYRISLSASSYGATDSSGRRFAYFLDKVLVNGKPIKNHEIVVKKGEKIKDVKLIVSPFGSEVAFKVTNYHQANELFGYVIPFTEDDMTIEDLIRIKSRSIYSSRGTFSMDLAPGRYFVITGGTDLAKFETDEEKLKWLNKQIPTARSILVKKGIDLDIDLETSIDED